MVVTRCPLQTAQMFLTDLGIVLGATEPSAGSTFEVCVCVKVGGGLMQDVAPKGVFNSESRHG